MGVAERFFYVLNVELMHGETYNIRELAKTTVYECIERFSPVRGHSYLGCLSQDKQKNMA